MTAKETQAQFDKRAAEAKEQYAKEQQATYHKLKIMQQNAVNYDQMQQRAASLPPGPGLGQNYGGLGNTASPPPKHGTIYGPFDSHSLNLSSFEIEMFKSSCAAESRKSTPILYGDQSTEQYQQQAEEECDYIPNNPHPRSTNQIIDDAFTDNLIYSVKKHWKCILLYLFIAVCIYGRISRRAAEPVVSVVYTPAYTYATPEVFAWDYDDDLEGYRYPAIYCTLPTVETTSEDK